MSTESSIRVTVNSTSDVMVFFFITLKVPIAHYPVYIFSYYMYVITSGGVNVETKEEFYENDDYK